MSTVSDQVLATLTDGQTGVAGITHVSGITVAGTYLLVSSASQGTIAVFAVLPGSPYLQFEQVVRSGAGGFTALNGPVQIFASPSGASATVVTEGATGEPGGFLSVTLATTVPAPQALLTQFAGIPNVGLTTGSGNDIVGLLTAPPSDVHEERINTSAGDDELAIDALAPLTVVDPGDGDDTIIVSATTQNAELIASGGAGSDTIDLLQAAAHSSYYIHGGEALSTANPAAPNNAADGADTVDVDATKIDPTATVACTATSRTWLPATLCLSTRPARHWHPAR